MILLIILYTIIFFLLLIMYTASIYFLKFKKINILIFYLILFFALSGYITNFVLKLEDNPMEGSRVITNEEIENW